MSIPRSELGSHTLQRGFLNFYNAQNVEKKNDRVDRVKLKPAHAKIDAGCIFMVVIVIRFDGLMIIARVAAGSLTFVSAANSRSMKKYSRYVMAAVYILAGINHFIHPVFYRSMLPVWLPWPEQIISVSGACEVSGALLLLYPRTQEAGAWFIIVLLIAIFPANVQMMINFGYEHNPYLWVAIVRLPVQLLLIWWAWMYTRPDARPGAVDRVSE